MSAIHDQANLNHPLSSIARISDHRKSKVAAAKNYQKRKCSGCGSTEHGIHGTKPRSEVCPAWGKTCTNCDIPNHDENACRAKPSATANSILLIAHVHYNEYSDTFSTPNEDVVEIAAKLTHMSSQKETPSAHLTIFPDSGATICVAGTKHIAALNLQPSQLHPCNKRVTAVGGSILKSKGWANIKFDIDGHTTIQPLFFCDKVDRIYFSKKGCLATNILPSSFPHLMPKDKIAAISPVNADHVPETAIIKPASEYSSKSHLTPQPSNEEKAQAA